MIEMFDERIVATGRLPLFAFFVAFLITFVLTRVNVRLIRADVRWWFRNVTAYDLHIHHVVFGVVLMLATAWEPRRPGRLHRPQRGRRRRVRHGLRPRPGRVRADPAPQRRVLDGEGPRVRRRRVRRDRGDGSAAARHPPARLRGHRARPRHRDPDPRLRGVPGHQPGLRHDHPPQGQDLDGPHRPLRPRPADRRRDPGGAPGLSLGALALPQDSRRYQRPSGGRSSSAAR